MTSTQDPSRPLDRLLQPDTAVALEVPAPRGDATWLRSDGWRLLVPVAEGHDPPGEPLAAFSTADGHERVATWDAARGRVHLPFDPNAALDTYQREAWRAGPGGTQLSTKQLDLFYRVKRLIPRRVQLAGRRALIRRQGLPEFPEWPLDLSVVKLLHFYGLCLLAASGRDEVGFRWFWPRGHRAAAILTHDVESAEGLRLAVELADLEEERGLRSSFNVVADWYPIDHGILAELTDRGFEIGVHGVHHDRSMFSSRASFDAQQPAVRAAAAAFGAEGFRSPATHRVYDWLGDLPVGYDCSIPHSDPFEPQPGGCCTLWPFAIGSVVELPYTLPQDHTLLTLMGKRTPDLWLEQLAAIERHHGLAQSLTHPDPGYLADPGKRTVYAEFLDRLVDRPGLWRSLPREVARWWRDRDAASEPAATARGTIRRGEGFFGVVVEPPAGDGVSAA